MGFVPNSSSSSFIVTVWSGFFERKGRLISKATEESLVKYGFKKTHVYFPEQYDYYADQCNEKIEESFENSYYNYGYAVACNQDEVIRFLVKNKIPFRASEHYDHYVLVYEGGDTVWRIPNYGIMYQKFSEDRSVKEAIGRLVSENEGFQEVGIYHYMSKKEQEAYIQSIRKPSKKKPSKKFPKGKKK